MLALGIMTAIQKSLGLINGFQKNRVTYAGCFGERSLVYDMLLKADGRETLQMESLVQKVRQS